MTDGKIKREHLLRKAFLYIRQSTLRQVYENTESTKRQYALREKLVAMGWPEGQIEVIDSDLGQSGSDSEGRLGFQHLVSEVSMGRAGIVAGIEVSRLSRSSSDFNRLLQIAALSNTLIMDEDGLYNVNDFNDRLLLGLKGTLSEAELHYLKARMRGGQLNKAKRGELVCLLAIGYVHDDNNKIIKSPDMQIQEAINLFFATFKRCGSAQGVVREFKKQAILFPSHISRSLNSREIVWKNLSSAQALHILKNPVYAGIYAYGRCQTKHTINGIVQEFVPKEQYHAYILDAHPAYISEAQFEENKAQIAKNASPRPSTPHSGAVREGSGLLQGIALCGICGRKMQIRYYGKKPPLSPMYKCYGESGRDNCQSIGGGNIDYTIGELLLETINPLTMESAISIQREMEQRKDEILRLYSQQLERARYEMEMAKRRYLRVDPDNRLVAAELERDWNQKAGEHESAKAAYDEKCKTEVRAVDNALKSALEQLVSDFPKAWNDPQTSSKEKKRIARLILEDVAITVSESIVTLGIRFKGGSTKILEMPKYKRDILMVNNEMEIVSQIRTMIPKNLPEKEIASILNEKGYTQGSGKPITVTTIRNYISRHSLPTRLELARADNSEGWLTTKEKCAELGISRTKLYRMRRDGEVVFKPYYFNKWTFLYKPESTIN